MSKKVQLEFEGDFAWVWLTDPRGLNVMGTSFFNEFTKALDEIEKRKAVRGAVLATNDKNFSMGLDLKEFMAATPEDLLRVTRQAGSLFNRVAHFSFPTLILLKGYSIGGALELGVACDFRFAAEDAQISFPAAKIGFFNPAATCYRLPRLIGLARAKELMFTGKIINAVTAQQWGLLNEVTGSSDLITKGRQWTQQMEALESQGLQSTKRLLDSSFEMTISDYIKIENRELETCCLRSEPIELMKGFWKK